jgi:DNA-binding transcriptional regulator GbsR (MarR family)
MSSTATDAPFPPLTSQVVQFIERFGRHYERVYGIPRIAGRIWGLLILEPEPMTIDEIGTALGVSHGSVSTNLRLLAVLGVVEKISLPSDRCDYYQFSPAAWDIVLKKRLDSISGLRDMTMQAMQEVQPEGAVRTRLEEMFTWINLAYGKYEELIKDWQEYTSESRS